MDETHCWLLVGLGNPGREYERTRHNAGFLALDYFASQHTLQFQIQKRYSAEIAERTGAFGTLLLVKPQTYMNRSGDTVGPICSFYKIPPSRIIVVQDELDIPLGEVRLKQGGGTGGHNGLKSIQASIGSAEFIRIRVGIGKPSLHAESGVVHHVLSPFDADEQVILREALHDVALAIEEILRSGLSGAQSCLSGIKSKRIKALK